jgi:hypothetical protein
LHDDPASGGAYIQADQPWGDAVLAPLYDAFPFSADIPLYKSLAAAQGGNVLEIACGSGRLVLPLAAADNYIFRFEAEHLLERAGLEIEEVYGGYRQEPFMSESPLMLFLARRP